MRFVYLLIVLALPLLDLYATVRIARLTQIPLWVWFGLPLIAGCLLLRNERLAFRAHTSAAMHGEYSLLRGLVDSGRKVLAGFLLMLPGVISDVIALMLLALPINIGRHEYAREAAGARHYPRRTIDGDYRRLD
jgi:UPF0716 protein FxsA